MRVCECRGGVHSDSDAPRERITQTRRDKQGGEVEIVMKNAKDIELSMNSRLILSFLHRSGQCQRSMHSRRVEELSLPVVRIHLVP